MIDQGRSAPVDGSIPAVVATNFSAWYETATGPRHVVSDMNMRVMRREFIALIGPSGCGKSTFLRALAGLHREEDGSGELSVIGKTVAQAQRNRDVAFMFQKPALMPWLSLADNVAIPLAVSKTKEPKVSPEAMLEMVGLGGFEKALPRECSGGMQQRAAIARSLILDPFLLLMDEPFGALDEITRERLNHVLLETWRNNACTVLFVTHSLSEAVYLADRVFVMSDRPARIKGIVDVNLPRDRDPGILGTKEFLDVENQVRDLLHGDTERIRSHESALIRRPA